MQMRSGSRRLPSWLAACLFLLVAAPAFANVGVSAVATNPAPVAGGIAFAYEAQVTTDSIHGNVVLTLQLPSNARFHQVSVSGPQAGRFSCEGPAVDTQGTVVCEAALVPASTSVFVTVVVAFDDAMAAGVRIMRARVTSGTFEDTAQVQVDVTNNATVSTSMTEAATRGRLIRRIRAMASGSSAVPVYSHIEPLPANARVTAIRGSEGLHHRCHYEPVLHAVSCVAKYLPSGEHLVTISMVYPDHLFRDSFD